MQYFSNEFIKFFKELEKNNRKEWFHDNKKRYENEVRKPMIALVGDIISDMNKVEDSFTLDPKKCLGRINRDIRFAKDKTPYNKHLFANITSGEKTNPKPGIAFRFGAHDGGIMGGHYQLSKDGLEAIRSKIKDNVDQFQKLKSEKKFVEKFGEIKGEAYKRIPTDLQATFEKEPLIANKQFYYIAEKPAEFVLSENLREEIIDYWMAARHVNRFLS